MWKDRGTAVHGPTEEIFFRHAGRTAIDDERVEPPSRLLSLDLSRRAARIARPSYWRCVPVVTIYRFEETINGREYRIEVSAVSTGQWRAQLMRVPGGSCALMPFYGTTPEEAARQLTEWLGRAHRAAIRPS
jgi:hypothetical protein